MATMTVTMTALDEKILASAQKRRNLLQTMQETEYAVKGLSSKTAQINNLKYQISHAEKNLAQLHAVSEQERHKVDSSHHSHARKAFHSKATWAAREAQEEQQYTLAKQQEDEEKKNRFQLGESLQSIEGEKAAVESDQIRHTQAQKQLAQLYESLFAGPTPQFPREDEKEEAVNEAQDQYQQSQIQLQTETQAMEALNASAQSLNAAMQSLQSSNTMATMDIFAGGDLVDLMERQRLSQAQGALTQCIFQLNEARRIQPLIPPLPDVFIDQGHILSNVVFNCAITDFMQAQRIQNTVQQCQMACNQMQGSIGQQQMRVQSVQANASRLTRELEVLKNELWHLRSDAFEQVLNGARAH